MGRLKYIFFIVFLISLFVGEVDADVCDNDDIAKLKEIAKLVTVTSDYIEEYEQDDNYGVYNVGVHGLTNEIYGELISSSSITSFNYDDSDSNGDVEKEIISGKYKLYLYSSNCDNTLLRKVEVALPVYNVFSTYDECKEINENDLKVCNKFLDENITYEDFIKNINEYKNKIDKNKGAKEESLITKYKYVFIIVGVVFVITIIFILIRNHKRNVLD